MPNQTRASEAAMRVFVFGPIPTFPAPTDPMIAPGPKPFDPGAPRTDMRKLL